MAQYLLSVWHDDQYEVDFTSPEAQRKVATVGAFNGELVESGALVFAGGLQPNSTATVFHDESGTTVMTEGAYSNSPKQMGGFWVIDVASADEAVKLAKRAAVACGEPVELRPFQGG